MAETGTKGENVAKGPGRLAVQVATFRQHAALLPLALSPSLQYVGGKILHTGDTESKQKIYLMCHMSHVICHVSCVTFHCHMSLTPTSTATGPPPTTSPLMHNRLVCKDTPQKKFAYISDKLINQKSSVHQEAGLTAGHK